MTACYDFRFSSATLKFYNSVQLYLNIGIRSTGPRTIFKQFVPILICMCVLSAELVINLVLNLVSLDTKFSSGGGGSHCGKHGIDL